MRDSTAEPAVGHVVLHDLDRIRIGDFDAADFVKGHHIPVADEADLPACVVVKEVRRARFSAGEQHAVWRHLTECIGLTGAPWAELDEVVVLLDEGDESHEQQDLQPWRHAHRLQPDTSQEEVDPFFPGHGSSAFQELVQIEPGQLDRLQIDDVERAVLLALLGQPKLNVDDRPNTPFKKALVPAIEFFSNVNLAVTEVVHRRPVLVFARQEPNPHAVDKTVPAFLLDHGLGFISLIMAEVIRRQGLFLRHPRRSEFLRRCPKRSIFRADIRGRRTARSRRL